MLLSCSVKEAPEEGLLRKYIYWVQQSIPRRQREESITSRSAGPDQG